MPCCTYSFQLYVVYRRSAALEDDFSAAKILGLFLGEVGRGGGEKWLLCALEGKKRHLSPEDFFCATVSSEAGPAVSERCHSSSSSSSCLHPTGG